MHAFNPSAWEVEADTRELEFSLVYREFQDSQSSIEKEILSKKQKQEEGEEEEEKEEEEEEEEEKRKRRRRRRRNFSQHLLLPSKCLGSFRGVISSAPLLSFGVISGISE